MNLICRKKTGNMWDKCGIVWDTGHIIGLCPPFYFKAGQMGEFQKILAG
jgi:hypothetical protein